MKLIAKLDTATNKANREASGICSEAIMQKLLENYKGKNFRPVIEAIIKSAELSEDEQSLAAEIEDFLGEHDGVNKIFEIKVYDANGNNKRNVRNERSIVVHLEDGVSDYIDKRKLVVEGIEAEYECLDMVVDLNAKVGYK